MHPPDASEHVVRALWASGNFGLGPWRDLVVAPDEEGALEAGLAVEACRIGSGMRRAVRAPDRSVEDGTVLAPAPPGEVILEQRGLGHACFDDDGNRAENVFQNTTLRVESEGRGILQLSGSEGTLEPSMASGRSTNDRDAKAWGSDGGRY